MMKQFGLGIIFALLTSSANANSKADEVLNGYINAWNSHDKMRIASFYAPNVTWYDLTTDSEVTSKKNVSKAITDYFMGYVDDMYWVKNGDVYISGNTVAYEWIYGGTFNGTWGDQEITNKVFSLKGISTTTINENGKIIEHKDYYDMESFKRGLGVTL